MNKFIVPVVGETVCWWEFMRQQKTLLNKQTNKQFWRTVVPGGQLERPAISTWPQPSKMRMVTNARGGSGTADLAGSRFSPVGKVSFYSWPPSCAHGLTGNSQGLGSFMWSAAISQLGDRLGGSELQFCTRSRPPTYRTGPQSLDAVLSARNNEKHLVLCWSVLNIQHSCLGGVCIELYQGCPLPRLGFCHQTKNLWTHWAYFKLFRTSGFINNTRTWYKTWRLQSNLGERTEVTPTSPPGRTC